MSWRPVDLRGPALPPSDVRGQSLGQHVACDHCGRLLLTGGPFDRVLFDLSWSKLLGVPAHGPGSLAWWAAQHLSAVHEHRYCAACLAEDLARETTALPQLWKRASRSAAALYSSPPYSAAAEEALRRASIAAVATAPHRPLTEAPAG